MHFDQNGDLMQYGGSENFEVQIGIEVQRGENLYLLNKDDGRTKTPAASVAHVEGNSTSKNKESSEQQDDAVILKHSENEAEGPVLALNVEANIINEKSADTMSENVISNTFEEKSKAPEKVHDEHIIWIPGADISLEASAENSPATPEIDRQSHNSGETTPVNVTTTNDGEPKTSASVESESVSKVEIVEEESKETSLAGEEAAKEENRDVGEEALNIKSSNLLSSVETLSKDGESAKGESDKGSKTQQIPDGEVSNQKDKEKECSSEGTVTHLQDARKLGPQVIDSDESAIKSERAGENEEIAASAETDTEEVWSDSAQIVDKKMSFDSDSVKGGKINDVAINGDTKIEVFSEENVTLKCDTGISDSINGDSKNNHSGNGDAKCGDGDSVNGDNKNNFSSNTKSGNSVNCHSKDNNSIKDSSANGDIRDKDSVENDTKNSGSIHSETVQSETPNGDNGTIDSDNKIIGGDNKIIDGEVSTDKTSKDEENSEKDDDSVITIDGVVEKNKINKRKDDDEGGDDNGNEGNSRNDGTNGSSNNNNVNNSRNNDSSQNNGDGTRQNPDANGSPQNEESVEGLAENEELYVDVPEMDEAVLFCGYCGLDEDFCLCPHNFGDHNDILADMTPEQINLIYEYQCMIGYNDGDNAVIHVDDRCVQAHEESSIPVDGPMFLSGTKIASGKHEAWVSCDKEGTPEVRHKDDASTIEVLPSGRHSPESGVGDCEDGISIDNTDDGRSSLFSTDSSVASKNKLHPGKGKDSDALEVVASAIFRHSKSEEKSTLPSSAPLCFRINARPPEGSLYYFAYGADMNCTRMKMYLGGQETQRLWGILYGFQLLFNRKGTSEEAGGFPNISLNPESSVEGCVYCLTPSQLASLDAMMGFPQFYVKVVLPVWMMNCANPHELGVAQYCVPAVMYVAKNEWTHADENAPLQYSYNLNQCLKGADLLSPDYIQHLKALQVC